MRAGSIPSPAAAGLRQREFSMLANAKPSSTPLLNDGGLESGQIHHTDLAELVKSILTGNSGGCADVFQRGVRTVCCAHALKALLRGRPFGRVHLQALINELRDGLRAVKRRVDLETKMINIMHFTS